MLHTVGMRQSVIMTRIFDYAALCQSAIMTFCTTMLHYGMLLDVALLSVMRHFTIPPIMARGSKLGELFPEVRFSQYICGYSLPPLQSGWCPLAAELSEGERE